MDFHQLGLSTVVNMTGRRLAFTLHQACEGLSLLTLSPFPFAFQRWGNRGTAGPCHPDVSDRTGTYHGVPSPKSACVCFDTWS